MEANIEAQARAAPARVAAPRFARALGLAADAPCSPRAQLAGTAPYSLDCLLAVLRLYLIFPDTSKPAIVSGSLLLALHRLPESDFSLCLHLVPERAQAEADVTHLVSLAGHLEACRFKDFWAAATAPGSCTAGAAAAGFAAAARSYIGGTLASAYRSLPSSLAAEALNFGEDGAALSTWVAQQQGWSLDVAAGVISLPRTEGNDPQPAAAAETIPFAKLEGLIKGMA